MTSAFPQIKIWVLASCNLSRFATVKDYRPLSNPQATATFACWSWILLRLWGPLILHSLWQLPSRCKLFDGCKNKFVAIEVMVLEEHIGAFGFSKARHFYYIGAACSSTMIQNSTHLSLIGLVSSRGFYRVCLSTKSFLLQNWKYLSSWIQKFHVVIAQTLPDLLKSFRATDRNVVSAAEI